VARIVEWRSGSHACTSMSEAIPERARKKKNKTTNSKQKKNQKNFVLIGNKAMKPIFVTLSRAPRSVNGSTRGMFRLVRRQLSSDAVSDCRVMLMLVPRGLVVRKL